MKSIAILLALFSIMACQERSNVQATLTSLDKLVIQADTVPLENPTKTLLLVNKQINEKWPKIKEYVSPLEERLDTAGLIKYKFYSGVINKKNINLTIAAYKTPKHALNSFAHCINLYKCCIPEKDLISLKNFENLKTFKDGGTKIVYSDNLVATMTLGKNINDNKEFNQFLEQFFNSERTKKLEIGESGPAEWTRK